MPLHKELGRHFIVDFKECDPARISFMEDVEPAFLKAAEKSGATIIDSRFYQFKPIGVSGIILLAESHFSVHTYPEDGFVAFDVFTCGKMDPQMTIDELKKYFCSKEMEVHVFSRGV